MTDIETIKIAVLVAKHDCLVERFEERRDADQRALILQAAVYEVKLNALVKDAESSKRDADGIKRLVYIGVGLILAMQFLMLWVKK